MSRSEKEYKITYYRYADKVLIGDEVLVQLYDNVMPIEVIDVSDLMLSRYAVVWNYFYYYNIFLSLLSF